MNTENIQPIKLVDGQNKHKDGVIRLSSDPSSGYKLTKSKSSNVDKRSFERKQEEKKSDKPETILFESNVLADKLEGENEHDLGRGFGSKDLSLEVKDNNFKSIEEQWTQENHATLNPWLIKLIIVIVILLLAFAIWAFSAREKNLDENLAKMPLLTSIDEEKIKQEDQNNRRKAVIGFLQASTSEERLKWCRNSEDTKAKMQNYYRNESFKSFKFTEILNSQDLTDKEIVLIIAGLDKNVTNGIEKVPLILIKQDDGAYCVDWEAFVVYQPSNMKSFMSSMSTEPHAFRLEVASRIGKGPYLYSFNDDRVHQAYRVNIKGDEENYLYAYSKVGSKEESQLREIFDSSIKLKRRVILTLAYPEDSETEQCVEIIRVDSDLWYLP